MPVGANVPRAAGRGGQLGKELILFGEVLDIILDDNHMSYDIENGQVIGCCKIRVMPRDVGKDPDTCNWFPPHSMQDLEIPLVGEIVTLIRTGTQALSAIKEAADYFGINQLLFIKNFKTITYHWQRVSRPVIN